MASAVKQVFFLRLIVLPQCYKKKNKTAMWHIAKHLDSQLMTNAHAYALSQLRLNTVGAQSKVGLYGNDDFQNYGLHNQINE